MLGFVLVLISWVLCTITLVLLGLGPAAWIARGRPITVVLRSAVWYGLLIAIIVISALNLAVPLKSGYAAAGFFVVVLGAGVLGVVSIRKTGGYSHRNLRAPALGAPLLIALFGGGIYLAVAAMGPVTNYDTGLYHLGAIGYSGEFSTIRGLANLYFPFGYSNSNFVLSAFLGNGPWDGEGFRLVNGLLMNLMALDLVLRLLQRRFSVGTFVLMTGLFASWVPMLALSDYWVTSPSQDSAVLAITIVSSAYLSDSLACARTWQYNAGVAIVTCVILVTMRPLMAFFAVATTLILFTQWMRIRRWPGPERVRSRVWIVVGLLALVAASVQTARDYFLSGWIQFPLSLVSFDVPWRAPNPTWVTSATLWAARDPELPWQEASGFSWVPSWALRQLSQWEVYEFALLAVTAVLSLALAFCWTRRTPSRTMWIAMGPSLLTVAVWWLITPPSFRFIWGPMFMLAVIPLSWALSSLPKARLGWRRSPRDSARLGLILSGSALVLFVLGYGALFRLDLTSMTQVRSMNLGPMSLAYRVTPITPAVTENVVLQDGFAIQIPVMTDQCWAEFPLCAGQRPASLRPRGTSIQEGFSP